jgi:hypothetical protein
MELDDSIVAVPIGDGAKEYKGVLKMNETAAAIFKLMEKGLTESEIVDAIEREYEVPREKLVSDVQKYISLFEAEGLIVR